MIGQIIKLLQSDEFTGVSENVEIAKGKFEIVRNRKQFIKHIKRTWLTKHIR